MLNPNSDVALKSPIPYPTDFKQIVPSPRFLEHLISNLRCAGTQVCLVITAVGLLPNDGHAFKEGFCTSEFL